MDVRYETTHAVVAGTLKTLRAAHDKTSIGCPIGEPGWSATSAAVSAQRFASEDRDITSLKTQKPPKWRLVSA
jgi:hypothetical protein